MSSASSINTLYLTSKHSKTNVLNECHHLRPITESSLMDALLLCVTFIVFPHYHVPANNLIWFDRPGLALFHHLSVHVLPSLSACSTIPQCMHLHPSVPAPPFLSACASIPQCLRLRRFRRDLSLLLSNGFWNMTTKENDKRNKTTTDVPVYMGAHNTSHNISILHLAPPTLTRRLLYFTLFNDRLSSTTCWMCALFLEQFV